MSQGVAIPGLTNKARSRYNCFCATHTHAHAHAHTHITQTDRHTHTHRGFVFFRNNRALGPGGSGGALSLVAQAMSSTVSLRHLGLVGGPPLTTASATCPSGAPPLTCHPSTQHLLVINSPTTDQLINQPTNYQLTNYQSQVECRLRGQRGGVGRRRVPRGHHHSLAIPYSALGIHQPTNQPNNSQTNQQTNKPTNQLLLHPTHRSSVAYVGNAAVWGGAVFLEGTTASSRVVATFAP
jgi:hypothetical protein